MEQKTVADKKADLAGPGIGNYEDLEKILPSDYSSLLTPKETQKALYAVKTYIEQNLCKELNLIMVEVPLIVDVESGVNDMLDRDGSRTPIQFHIKKKLGRLSWMVEKPFKKVTDVIFRIMP